MQLHAYTIRDSASDLFSRPFFAPSDGAAIRTFSDEVNGGDTPISQHPADYTLFSLGYFEEDTGMFNSHAPNSLGNGSQFLINVPRHSERAHLNGDGHAEA